MRKDLLVLGACLLFLGTIFLSVSRVAQSGPSSWPQVASDSEPGGADSLSVQGNLTTGDTWQIYFAVRFTQQQITMDEGAYVTLTDPSNNTLSYDIPIYSGPMPEYFPTDKANHTGLYTVNASRYGLFTKLTRLELRKMELSEPRYPYGLLLPIGVVVLGGGAGTSLLGAKSSKPPRRRSLKHKG